MPSNNSSFEEIPLEWEKLIKEHFQKLQPVISTKENAILHMEFRGYQDLLFTVRALLNVCVLTLEHKDFITTKTIQEPEVHIQTVLELAVQLLPFEEGEFLDIARKFVKDKKGCT